MLLIPCPWCGPRPETEFSGGTGAERTRPGRDEMDDTAWITYLLGDPNTVGEQNERWCHTHGCGQWFLLERDTGTGALGKVSRLAPPQPSAPKKDEPAPTAPSPEGTSS